MLVAIVAILLLVRRRRKGPDASPEDKVRDSVVTFTNPMYDTPSSESSQAAAKYSVNSSAPGFGDTYDGVGNNIKMDEDIYSDTQEEYYDNNDDDGHYDDFDNGQYDTLTGDDVERVESRSELSMDSDAVLYDPVTIEGNAAEATGNNGRRTSANANYVRLDDMEGAGDNGLYAPVVGRVEGAEETYVEPNAIISAKETDANFDEFDI